MGFSTDLTIQYGHIILTDSLAERQQIKRNMTIKVPLDG